MGMVDILKRIKLARIPDKHQYLFIMQLIIELKRNYSKTIKAALLLKHSNLNIIDIYMKLCHQQATNWSPGQWVDT